MSTSKIPPSLPGLIDAHCHLDYAPMSEDLAATLQRAREAGVVQFVHVGCSLESLDRAMALGDADPRIFLSIGVHPHEANTLDDGAIDRLRTLAAHKKVVAIGETGLDYYYDRSPREDQARALLAQRDLADELDLPLVLHIRDAHDEAINLLRDSPPKAGGMVHCFTGGISDAERWLALGLHLSFSGIATFPKAAEVAAAAKRCPADRLLVETDAPYLAPAPVRGRRNHPANVAFTCSFLANLRGEDPGSLAKRAARNTRTLLRLPEPDAA